MTAFSVTRDNLTGDWELLSFEETGPEGLVLKSAPASKGLLIYTSTGAMSVSMYREILSDEEDLKRNFVKDIYYAGTYEIQGDFIIHHVKIALHVRHRDQSLERRAQFRESGKVLVLEALNHEGKVLGTIIWKRILQL